MSPTGIPDLYAVLGVAPHATPSDIRRAYIAKINAFSNAQLSYVHQAMVHMAYAVLEIADRRAQYDQERSRARQAMAS